MRSSTSHRASHDRARLAALWGGVLAGPVVWLVLLEVNYVLSYVACETRQRWFLHLATLVAIGLVAGAGIWAWRARLADPLEAHDVAPPLSEETSVQRAAWMAAVAAAFSIWFVLLIIATHIPVMILKPCQ